MKRIAPEVWKEDLAEFREKTDQFYEGELDKAAYKGFPAVMEVMPKGVERPACSGCVWQADG